MKEMELKEFVDSGLLQEINRRLLHPMGLALAVEEENAGPVKGRVNRVFIVDARDDPEGFCFAEDNPDFTKEKEENVDRMLNAKRASRWDALGYFIQETPERRE